MVGNTPKDRMQLRVREREHVSISVFSRVVMCTAITLAQRSERVNLPGTKTAEIAGNKNGRGDKNWK